MYLRYGMKTIESMNSIVAHFLSIVCFWRFQIWLIERSRGQLVNGQGQDNG